MFENTKAKIAELFDGVENKGLRETLDSRLESYENGVVPIPHTSNVVRTLFDGFGLTHQGIIKKEEILTIFGKELKEVF